jgi:hypothetical protein
MDISLISHFLPIGLLNHFDIIDFEEIILSEIQKDGFYIYLDEKNIIPNGFNSTDFESKGFFNTATIQDFPIRGKALFLVIRRRRWREKKDKNNQIKSDFSFIAEGSKLTLELSDFLKGTGREPSRYDN